MSREIFLIGNKRLPIQLETQVAVDDSSPNITLGANGGRLVNAGARHKQENKALKHAVFATSTEA